MGLPSMSHPDFFLKIRRKLGSLRRWLRKVPEGLYVFTPVSFPFYSSPVLRKLNQILLVLQLRLVKLVCKIDKPVVWAAIPSAVDVVEQLGAKMVVYQVSDKYDANISRAENPSLCHPFTSTETRLESGVTSRRKSSSPRSRTRSKTILRRTGTSGKPRCEIAPGRHAQCR